MNKTCVISNYENIHIFSFVCTYLNKQNVNRPWIVFKAIKYDVPFN